ncbi:Hypothetical protein PP7435_CHR1-0718 [Komagataella phaffii CBS 7435]|uniref:RING-type domain-containing protein n=2 Tax=Komagataella phaffii TaxID=460519 RepID=C4QX03_KOMPG|nr:Hypothetical protein PAS_chr1-1_0399 [Komagataella phaffii GS115]AOA61755.1 GQ67_02248T0 [Komagataella phaffii]CAH2446572.1 Hypothetical protein BQ9382_C1-3695 [Komagataella phaffii CBS 7435]AOA66010.1 GQ68_02262T0 [Komagataella phaffii GS115]CAY67776.1 Hypothetical protein PAS_chr1-1_0399 [Komagataella phaffii GS115]CCA36861.1 Hypothetical protein PP7435_CHR1-0718 [Komagataella phaffii CBS 7435]
MEPSRDSAPQAGLQVLPETNLSGPSLSLNLAVEDLPELLLEQAGLPPSSPMEMKFSKAGFNYLSDEDSKIDLRTLIYLEPLEHLNCPICQLPFIDPYTTICGHTYCYTCLEEALKSPLGSRCPLDRTPLDIQNNDDVYPAPIIISNITDDLKVKCMNLERGCDWVGPRWQIKKHIVQECKYTQFECNCTIEEPAIVDQDDNDRQKRQDDIKPQYRICKEWTERRHLLENDKGERICPHQPEPCEKCGKIISFSSKEYHLNEECKRNLKQCNGCLLDFPITNFENHERYCEKIHVKCPAKAYGCDWKGSKDLLDTIHANRCVFYKLSSYFETQEREMEGLRRENRTLSKQLSTVLDSVVQGKITNVGYTLNVEEVGAQRQNKKNDKSLLDEDYLHLVMEFERLRTDFERVRPIVADFQQQQQILTNLANNSSHYREEINAQRVAINSLRQQLQFLLVERRNLNRAVRGIGGISPAESSEELNRFSNKL